MGRYFKVIDKNRTDGRIDCVEADEIYNAIENIVGYWAELACEEYF